MINLETLRPDSVWIEASELYGHSCSARPVDYTQAYCVKIGEGWHNAVRVADLGDYLEVQLTTYQAIQCPKSAVTAIKVYLKGDTFVGKERRKFDIEVGAK